MNVSLAPEILIKDQLDLRIRSTETGGLRSSLRAKKASEFAALWVEAWNSQDLDCIVAHYSEGVVFSSHLLQTLGGGNSNTFGAA
jgi:hypothetical protein